MTVIFDLVILGLIAGLTYALTSEGLWGSALMFFNILFAGMIAFNFYEPLAVLVDKTGIGWGFSDCLCLLLLFCVALVVLRLTTETLAPAMVRFPMPVYHAGRMIFGLGGAVVTAAILLVGFECAPVHKKLFKAYTYQSKPPFNMVGLDHHWLGFFQHETGGPFAQYNAGGVDPFHAYGQGHPINLFDPRGEWLINHQNARPYGDEMIPPEEEATTKGEGGEAAQPAAGAPPG